MKGVAILVPLVLLLLPSSINTANAFSGVTDNNPATSCGVTITCTVVVVQANSSSSTGDSSSSVTNYLPITPLLGTGTSLQTATYWQYGLDWACHGLFCSYVGAAIDVTYFDSLSVTTSSFSFWLGMTDNKGYFYQSGFTWWPNAGSCDSYTGWSVDDYNGQSLGIGNCSPTGNQWGAQAITSGSEAIYVFLYSGQWYYYFSGSPESGYAPGGVQTFPGGADAASSVSGKAYAVTEGGGSGTFNTGEDIGQNYQYVSSVSYSNGVFTLTVGTPATGNFYKTPNSGNYVTPPSTANWYVSSTCPYIYASYFASTGSLPSNGASVSMC
jgi:hypothetical protein